MNNIDKRQDDSPPGARAFLVLHKQEIVRKAIHFLIALAPCMAAWNRTFTLLFLAGGVAVYAVMETLRVKGINVPLISFVTRLATRNRNLNRFVLAPVTLGLGALLALLLYPPLASAIAIYTLAFGDGLAGLTGKLFGRLRPAFLFRKSVEGSLVCFAVVFAAAFAVLRTPPYALVIAAVATVTEALPFGDYDNLVLPLVTGLTVHLLMLL